MKRILIFLTVVFCLPGICLAAESDIEGITKCYENYVIGIINNDAQMAYESIDRNTKAYYDRILEMAIHLDAKSTKKLSLLNKSMVLLARHGVEKQKLLKMNGADFFKYAVIKDWIGSQSDRGQRITNVDIDNNIASSNIVKDGQISTFGYVFYKEADGWKIDLTSIMPFVERELKKQLLKQQIDDDDFIFQMLEAISGKKVSKKIWKPLK